MSENTIQQDSVVIERTFDASAELVWRMWTDAELFKQWYGPHGFSVPVAEMDVRVGGKHLVCMLSPDGSMRMWTTGEYTEVSPTERLVYTDSPADEHGNVLDPAAAGMPPGYPAVTEVVVELSEAGGRTKMVMSHIGVSGPAEGGWSQAFEKMAALLAERANA